jgi:hypothetical protein
VVRNKGILQIMQVGVVFGSGKMEFLHIADKLILYRFVSGGLLVLKWK